MGSSGIYHRAESRDPRPDGRFKTWLNCRTCVSANLTYIILSPSLSSSHRVIRGHYLKLEDRPSPLWGGGACISTEESEGNKPITECLNLTGMTNQKAGQLPSGSHRPLPASLCDLGFVFCGFYRYICITRNRMSVVYRQLSKT